MPLHPQARVMIDRTMALNLPPVSQMTPAEARASVRQRSEALPREDVASVRDHSLAVEGGAITVRVFTPRGAAPKPALVYFHGGGWVTGDIESHEGICRTLANAADCVVASVDYRCAPEFAFPAAAEDAYAATRWVVERAGELGVDPRRLAVCGDSAGGNLAAVVALMARDRGGPALAFQVLVYPVTDCDFERPSYKENAEGYLLTRDSMRFYWDQYVPDHAARTHAYVSPMRAASLAGLPPSRTANTIPTGSACKRRATKASVSADA
jgi:acetyl esterase